MSVASREAAVQREVCSSEGPWLAQRAPRWDVTGREGQCVRSLLHGRLRRIPSASPGQRVAAPHLGAPKVCSPIGLVRFSGRCTPPTSTLYLCKNIYIYLAMPGLSWGTWDLFSWGTWELVPGTRD